MIFGKDYVFLELAKTGSTYARYVLLKLENTENQGKKHNIYSSLSADLKENFNKSLKVASIRNPYSYYASLFGFASSKRGGLYVRTTVRPDYLSYYNVFDLFYMSIEFLKNRKKWKHAYSDVNSMENFKRFMQLIFTENPTGPGFYFGLSDVHKYIGYYSHDFLRMCTNNYIESVKEFESFEDVEEFAKKNYLIDLMLKNENLKNDLLLNANSFGVSKEIMQEAIDSKPSKSRTSSKHKPFQDYYDEETRALVEEKEKLIIKRFNYRFD
jgi:hypothetical protein